MPKWIHGREEEETEDEQKNNSFYSVGMKLRLPFLTRDFTLWQKVRKDEGEDGRRDVKILARSAQGWDLPRGARIRPEAQGRVRGWYGLRGYRLRSEMKGGGRTEVTFVESLNLRGMLPQDLFTRNFVAPLRFKHVITDMEKMLEGNSRNSVPNPLGPVV